MASGCDVPVFIVTAAYVSAAAKMAAEAGAVALLKKPFDLEGFMKGLERYCGGELPIPALSAPATSNGKTSG